jgi:hypothetical protein
MLREIVAYKHSQLKLAHKALLSGFVLLVVSIIGLSGVDSPSHVKVIV